MLLILLIFCSRHKAKSAHCLPQNFLRSALISYMHILSNISHIKSCRYSNFLKNKIWQKQFIFISCSPILKTFCPCDICLFKMWSRYRSLATMSQLKMCDISREIFKALKCYNFLWVQRRHNCFPAVSFANYVLTLYLLKLHLQTFPSIPINKNDKFLSCDTLVANERYVVLT
jgi:hypothetical protein